MTKFNANPFKISNPVIFSGSAHACEICPDNNGGNSVIDNALV